MYLAQPRKTEVSHNCERTTEILYFIEEKLFYSSLQFGPRSASITLVKKISGYNEW